MNYYISDLHIGHKNVLKFDNRPFQTIEEHDSAIVRNWCNKVTGKDTVYLLGDISWQGAEETKKIMQQLPGKKVWILGNHDHKLKNNQEIRKEFEEITDYKEIKLPDGKYLILCHYPIPCFKNHMRGSYHFYGHVHNSWEWEMMEEMKKEMEDKNILCNMYNVGCMMEYMNYTPRTFEEIGGEQSVKE